MPNTCRLVSSPSHRRPQLPSPSSWRRAVELRWDCEVLATKFSCAKSRSSDVHSSRSAPSQNWYHERNPTVPASLSGTPLFSSEFFGHFSAKRGRVFGNKGSYCDPLVMLNILSYSYLIFGEVYETHIQNQYLVFYAFQGAKYQASQTCFKVSNILMNLFRRIKSKFNLCFVIWLAY